MAKVQPNASAKPTTKATKVKAPKKVRSIFALVGNPDPKQYPFAGTEVDGEIVATPIGYEFATMKGLKKKDFAKPSLFLTYLAEQLEWKAGKIRGKADEARKTGDGAGGNKANRLLKMLSKVDELRATLAAQGIDVDALLANTKAAPKAEGATTTA